MLELITMMSNFAGFRNSRFALHVAMPCKDSVVQFNFLKFLNFRTYFAKIKEQ